MDLRSGEILSFEALVRWKHPQVGLLGPDQFIGAAERSGLISSVTKQVLREAIRQAACWHRSGLPIGVAVNLSGEDFTHIPNLSAFLRRELRRWKLPGKRVTLELTETRALANLQEVGRLIGELKGSGIRFAIDDFGTGYANLEELVHLNVDEIKIDKQFVQGVSRDERRAAVFRAGHDLAKELGATVVAEGVENERDLAFIMRTGCDIIQGFLVSPPIPIREISQFLASWHERKDRILMHDAEAF